MPPLDMIAADATGRYELGSLDDHERIRQLADQLLETDASEADLGAIGADASRPLDLRLATKLALSKQRLGADADLRIGVVYAMWGEQRRLRPRDEQNPTGEDSLHAKLDQLCWLFADTDVDWRLYAVDDGDPDDSAAVALERAAAHRQSDRVDVLRLSDVVPTDSGPLADLAHVDDSRKGGAILLGASHALDAGCDAIVMTDADNSVDVGQLGLLLDAHARGADVVVGDRKHPDAVVVKAEARWGPGIVVLRHMQRMAGHALFSTGLRDTQAAFKLYSRRALDGILASPSTYGFAFDSDWLCSAVGEGLRIDRVPFAFIDSFEESASITQGPMSTWESLLQGLVGSVRARGLEHDEEMARLIDDHADVATLERVVQAVPDPLAGVADGDLGDPAIMPPGELRAWIEQLVAD